MEEVIYRYGTQELNRAGAKLVSETISPEESTNAIEVINNWRSSHNFPLATFRSYMNSRVNGRKKINRFKKSRRGNYTFITTRIKRLPSIKTKLERNPNMKLSTMQDIAGCRAIFASIDRMYSVVDRFSKDSKRTKYIRTYDYIKNPKESGYRSVHVVCEFHYKDSPQNGLKIEIQFRSKLQHIWATAVETVDTFTGQSLKSSMGKAEWQRFFQLMSTVIANKENKPIVPGTPNSPDELKEEIKKYAEALDAMRILGAYGAAIKITMEIEDPHDVGYYLLEFFESNLRVSGFRTDQLEFANEVYMAVESKAKNENVNIVLVSASSIQELKTTFPNYFSDTEEFLRILEETIL